MIPAIIVCIKPYINLLKTMVKLTSRAEKVIYITRIKETIG
jgi:hypothetical protein